MATTLESTPQAQKTSVSSIQPSSCLADAISQQAKELQELKEQLKTIRAQPVVAAASVHITCQLYMSKHGDTVLRIVSCTSTEVDRDSIRDVGQSRAHTVHVGGGAYGEGLLH